MPSFPGNDISTDKLPEKNPNKAQITSNQTLSMYYLSLIHISEPTRH